MITCTTPTTNYTSGRALLENYAGDDGIISIDGLIAAAHNCDDEVITQAEYNFVVDAYNAGNITTLCPEIKCKIIATSEIPLWYSDENGKFPIPHDSEHDCPMKHGMGFGISVSSASETADIAAIQVDVMDYHKVLFDETITDPGFEGRYKGYVECNGTDKTIHVTLTESPLSPIPTPILSIDSLAPDFADIKWNPLPIPSKCNAGWDDSMTYSIWFDGSKQADRTATHADFDDLTPGSTHTVQVQAVPRADWDCTASLIASITFTTPLPISAILHLTTIPTDAMVQISGVAKGTTDMEYIHTIPIAISARDRVAVKLTRNHFKDKTFNKTLRSGMHEYALYRLSPAHKIKGTSRKDSTAKEATYTFTVLDRKAKTPIREAGTELLLLNQITGQTKDLTTDAAGATAITISYDDTFFASGKNKLVCIMKDTADRIRTFRTITISKVAGDSVGIDEDWHDEDDAELEATQDSRNAVDAAYAGIGQ